MPGEGPCLRAGEARSLRAVRGRLVRSWCLRGGSFASLGSEAIRLFRIRSAQSAEIKLRRIKIFGEVEHDLGGVFRIAAPERDADVLQHESATLVFDCDGAADGLALLEPALGGEARQDRIPELTAGFV